MSVVTQTAIAISVKNMPPIRRGVCVAIDLPTEDSLAPPRAGFFYCHTLLGDSSAKKTTLMGGGLFFIRIIPQAGDAFIALP